MSESHSSLRIKKGLCCVNQSANQTETRAISRGGRLAKVSRLANLNQIISKVGAYHVYFYVQV